MYRFLNQLAHLVRYRQPIVLTNNAAVGEQIRHLIESVHVRNRRVVAIGFVLAGLIISALSGIRLDLPLALWLALCSSVASLVIDRFVLSMMYHQTRMLLATIVNAERYAYAQERYRGRLNNRIQYLEGLRIGLVARTIEIHTTNASADHWWPQSIAESGLFLGNYRVERQEVAWSQCPVGLRLSGVCVQPHVGDVPQGLPPIKAAHAETWAYDRMTEQTRQHAFGIIGIFATLGLIGAIISVLHGVTPEPAAWIAVMLGLITTWLMVTVGIQNRAEVLRSMRELVKDGEVVLITLYHHGDVHVLGGAVSNKEYAL